MKEMELEMSIKQKLIHLSDTNRIVGKLKLFYWRCKDYPDQYKVEKMIKKRKNGFIDEQFAKIKSLEGIHRNERCFIVATGPSLTMEDLQLIKDEVTFGMNSITRIFDKTDWRPTYYGIQDRQVYEKMERSIMEYYRNANNVIVADQLNRFLIFQKILSSFHITVITIYLGAIMKTIQLNSVQMHMKLSLMGTP